MWTLGSVWIYFCDSLGPLSIIYHPSSTYTTYLMIYPIYYLIIYHIYYLFTICLWNYLLIFYLPNSLLMMSIYYPYLSMMSNDPSIRVPMYPCLCPPTYQGAPDTHSYFVAHLRLETKTIHRNKPQTIYSETMTKGDGIRQLLNCVCAQTRVTGQFTKYITPFYQKSHFLVQSHNRPPLWQHPV